MTKSVIAFVAAALVALSAQAEDAELTRRLEPTLSAVARIAARAEQTRLVVVVREREGTKPGDVPPTAIPDVRNAVNSMLKEQGIKIVDAPDAAKILGLESDRKLEDPEQVAELKENTEFDALVTVDYQKVGKRTILRIALIDGERRRFVRTVRLPDSSETTNTQPLQPAKQTAVAGGLKLPAGTIPPLSAGPSGYLKGGTPTGSATTAGGGTAAGGGASNTEGAGAVEGGEETQTGGTSAKASKLNQAIVSFAVGQLGQQVGNGECWTLAAEALKAAGAQPPNIYDFGEEIKLSEITPGDILQFTSARFDLPGGGYIIMGTPNHTAVVYAPNGDQIFVLHQNFGKKIVTILDFRFANMTSGKVQAYRAQPGE